MYFSKIFIGSHERERDKRDVQHAWDRQETYKNIRHRGAEINTNLLKFICSL